MSQSIFVRPEHCLEGESYYLRTRRSGAGDRYRQVRFISYRPHPAEVVVNDGEGPRVVHRLDVFQDITSRGSGAAEKGKTLSTQSEINTIPALYLKGVLSVD